MGQQSWAHAWVMAAGIALLAGPVGAQAVMPISEPTPTVLRAGLAGRWAGALGYRDYQSNALFEIPVTTTIETVPDGVTQIRRSLFDDGPSKPVWITTVSLDDAEASSVTSASYRKGREVEVSTEAMTLARYVDPTHWTIVYRQTGEDDDKPSEIRVTETREGDSVLEVKAVRPVGSDDQAWAYRNQTRLTRVAD